MSSPTSVLVLGAGELGIEVLRSLATHPARNGAVLTVLKRASTTNSSVELDKLGIRIQNADVVASTEEELAKIFSAYHVVISCNGMTLPPETQVKLSKAAIRADVKRYFPWQFGLSYDDLGRGTAQNLFDAQLDVRDLLRGQSTMQWVIVSTGIFTSFLFEPAFDVVNIKQGSMTALGSWENRVTATSPVDIGRVVADLVFACPNVHGIVYAAGDTISMQELADTVDIALETKLQRKVATVKQLEAELQADPENGAKKYRAVSAAGIGTAWDKADTFNAARSMSMQTVREWTEQHLK
ncbi:hypothetical protein LTR56_014391 [Elasticomyces elasticus]|nr:hypothetical protein LTR22_020544 [Elasticomyces elasticus]KAK3636015.1 hypothetical protein LTR56_014391 [Elasticomyces elasticus]KAK4916658.1 hypothetical protein LTR49_015356 [Elasticomyces elasticus]KAK5754932.1 hypothetical protein LTS12_014965 [Elasticomyces elasticus]